MLTLRASRRLAVLEDVTAAHEEQERDPAIAKMELSARRRRRAR
jgi:hypothetical protein